jgi:hypothetical protein
LMQLVFRTPLRLYGGTCFQWLTIRRLDALSERFEGIFKTFDPTRVPL